MNEETSKLLEQLANKLGTTTEYLWGVLVHHAPISATVTLVQTILILLGCWGLWRIHKKLCSPHQQNSDYSYYCKYDAAASLPMCIAAGALTICLLAAFFSIGDIFNGYLDPEYWAFKEILSALHK